MSDYHTNIEALTRTQLKVFRDSREDFRMQYITGEMQRPEPSKPMLIGQVLHAVLLEGKKLSELVAVYPDTVFKINGTLNPEPAKIFRALNADRDCIKEEEYYAMQEAVISLADSELVQLIQLSHAREHTIDGHCHGRRIKCKADFVGELDEAVCIYDLKFMSERDPHLFQRNAKRLAYWLQDAHYTGCMRCHTEKPIRFRFAAVEVAYPNRVDWFEYDPRSREIATAEWEKLVLEFTACEVANRWIDKHHHTLSIGPWDVSEATVSEELVDIGDAT